MKRTWMTGAVIAAVTAGVSAHSVGSRNKQPMHDAMKMTYTGCVEAVNHGGTFLLTHIGEGGGAMHDMAGEPKAMKDDMSGAPVKPTALVLSGRAHLKKQVGKRVAITGSVAKGTADSLRSDLDTLRVDSLKVVAKSCM